MNKIIKNIKAIPLCGMLITSIFFAVSSCRTSDNINPEQNSNNQATIQINLTEAQINTNNNTDDLNTVASSAKINSPEKNQIQNQILPFDKDFSIVANLIPESANIKSNTVASVNPISGTPNTLRAGVMYKLAVYDNNGKFVTEKNYVTGKAPEPLLLNSDQKYTFIAYSVNRSDYVPPINNRGTLNLATINDVKDDLMYFKTSTTVSYKQTTYLNIVMKHLYSVLMTNIDASAIGSISAIDAVIMKPSASAVDMKLSDSSINYKNTQTGSVVNFPTKGSPKIQSSPTILMSGSTTSGQLNIGSITVNGTTKNNLSFSNLRIMPGERYSLNIILRTTNPAVSSCGGRIYWPSSNIVQLPYVGGNGGIFPGYSQNYFRSNYNYGGYVDGGSYNISISRTVLQNGNGNLTLNMNLVSGYSLITEQAQLTLYIGNTRCDYTLAR